MADLTEDQSRVRRDRAGARPLEGGALAVSRIAMSRPEARALSGRGKLSEGIVESRYVVRENAGMNLNFIMCSPHDVLYCSTNERKRLLVTKSTNKKRTKTQKTLAERGSNYVRNDGVACSSSRKRNQ